MYERASRPIQRTKSQSFMWLLLLWGQSVLGSHLENRIKCQKFGLFNRVRSNNNTPNKADAAWLLDAGNEWHRSHKLSQVVYWRGQSEICGPISDNRAVLHDCVCIYDTVVQAVFEIKDISAQFEKPIQKNELQSIIDQLGFEWSYSQLMSLVFVHSP